LGVGVTIFGTSYLAVLLVAWRIWFWKRPRSSFTWVSIPVMVVYVAPAVYLAYHGSTMREVDDWLLDAWMLPGFAGWVPGGLLVVLLVEAVLRTRARPPDLAPNPLAEPRPPG
jgi:hypothetical protein